MAKFDVFTNPQGNGYLLDVQTDLLAGLNTRVVVPLFPHHESPKPAKYLNPIFEINNELVVMTTQFLASVPESELKHFVENIKDQQQLITNAIDLLFVGF